MFADALPPEVVEHVARQAMRRSHVLGEVSFDEATPQARDIYLKNARDYLSDALAHPAFAAFYALRQLRGHREDSDEGLVRNALSKAYAEGWRVGCDKTLRHQTLRWPFDQLEAALLARLRQLRAEGERLRERLAAYETAKQAEVPRG